MSIFDFDSFPKNKEIPLHFDSANCGLESKFVKTSRSYLENFLEIGRQRPRVTVEPGRAG